MLLFLLLLDSLAWQSFNQKGKVREERGIFGKNNYLQNYAMKILVNSALLLLWTPFVLWSVPRAKRGAHKEKWQWDPSLLYKDRLLPVSTANLKHPKIKFKNVLGSGRTPWPWQLAGRKIMVFTPLESRVAGPEPVEVGGVSGAEAWSCRSCVWYVLKAGMTGTMGKLQTTVWKDQVKK